MPTKYELQAELRELNRGFPRIPISKMKMHELEAMIDSVKKMKVGTETAMVDKKPAVAGRPSSRPIVVEETEDEDVVIKTPQVPAARITGPPKKVKAEKPSISVPKPKVIKEEARVKSEKVSVCNCNCPSCPKRR
jgi:hypothetical protein